MRPALNKRHHMILLKSFSVHAAIGTSITVLGQNLKPFLSRNRLNGRLPLPRPPTSPNQPPLDFVPQRVFCLMIPLHEAVSSSFQPHRIGCIFQIAGAPRLTLLLSNPILLAIPSLVLSYPLTRCRNSPLSRCVLALILTVACLAPRP